jgi:hypothetical protein
MKTLSYNGRGWWAGNTTRFKKADDAVKVYGKDNVTRVAPGVWLITKNNEPHELLLMHRDAPKVARAKTAVVSLPVATAKKTRRTCPAPKCKTACKR